MLKRVYVDNFRCLVNFELKLDRVNLLLGENGAGKTTVFEVLHRLRQFLSGTVKLNAVFPAKDATRWQDTGLQRLEMDLQTEDGSYTYSLAIEHEEDKRRVKVKNEQLLFNQRQFTKVLSFAEIAESGCCFGHNLS
jgi:predicted ATPase